MKKRISFVRQLGTTDCGPACLSMIFGYYGCKVRINDIKFSVNIGRDGMSLAKMKEIAERNFFSFRAYSDFKTEDNVKDNLPVIMCSLKNHYVLVEKKINKGYVVYDPVDGRKIIDFRQLKDDYFNMLAVIRPTDHVSCGLVKSEKYKLEVNKLKFFMACVMTVATQMIILIPSLIIQQVVNELALPGTELNAFYFITLVLAIGAGYFIANFLKKRIILLLQDEIYSNTVKQMTNKLFKIDFEFFESHATGDIANRFNSINELYQFISGAVISTTIDMITAVLCGCVMAVQSTVLLGMVVMITIIQIAVILIINRKIRIKISGYIANQTQLESSLVEMLTNIQQIRCMHVEKILGRNLNERYLKTIDSLKNKNKLSDLLESVTVSVNIVTPLILYLAGGLLVAEGNMKMGTLIAFVTLSSYFISPFSTMSFVVPQIGVMKETLYRLREFMEFRNVSEEGTVRIRTFEDFEMNHVSFSYSGDDHMNIKNVSIRLNKGEKIAIVGTSGGGKTTIIKLLLNVLQHYEGKICINHYDIKEVSGEDISHLFSVVTQIPVAINGTIRENIDILHSLSDDEIYKLLSMVDMEQDVKAFPLGLNTYVGENGQNISGGQKQRLAIARALSTKPEVIVFDEATSNLDSVTERNIYSELKKKQISQVIVTHRLSAVKDADRIYVVDKGAVREAGTHEELMNQRGIYCANISN